MILRNQGSNLTQDSSLNKTPGENCYISGYKGPNEISQDFLEWKLTILAVIKFSDSEYETMTRGCPYNFAMLNSLETGHLGKMLISPNW